jgi:hypothetical protein
MGLSERRAQAIRDYLAKSEIPPEIMTAKGFGKSSPRVKATSPEAREKNRRVEIAIVGTVIKYVEGSASVRFALPSRMVQYLRCKTDQPAG